MGWKDTLAALRAEIAPEGSEPPALLAELETEIANLEVSHADALSGADARIQEYDGKLAGKDSEITRLKTVNYDLLMASKGDTDTGNGGGTNGGGSSDDNDDAPGGIDSLFGTSDDNE